MGAYILNRIQLRASGFFQCKPACKGYFLNKIEGGGDKRIRKVVEMSVWNKSWNYNFYGEKENNELCASKFLTKTLKIRGALNNGPIWNLN